MNSQEILEMKEWTEIIILNLQYLNFMLHTKIISG